MMTAGRWAGILCGAWLALAALVPGAAAKDGILDIGNGPPSETLDPHLAKGVHDARIIHELFEGLVVMDPATNILPGAAERWTTSPDGLTWTFTLRPDNRWSDGTPMVAEDFVAGLRRALDPATRAHDPRDLYAILHAEEVATGKRPPTDLAVAAPDDRTVVVTLWRPSPDILRNLASRTAMPVHRPSLAAHGTAFTRPGNLIGNGPYVLVENVPQSHVTLERNANWRAADTVRVPKVRFWQTEDASAALRRFRAGELDIAYGPPQAQVDWMRANLDGALRISPMQRTFYITLNFTKEPWKSSKALRHALMLAIDREALAEKVTRGVDRPAWTMVPPGTGGYEPTLPEWAGWTQAQRDARARELLAEAGFGRGGKPLSVELLYVTEEMRKQVSVALAAMWQSKLGIKVELMNQEGKVVWDRIRERTFSDLVYDSWTDGLPIRFLDLMLSTEVQNNGGYGNPAVDALLRKAEEERDTGLYHDLLRQAETLILQDAAAIPVLHSGGRVLVARTVQGWQDSPVQMTPLVFLGFTE